MTTPTVGLARLTVAFAVAVAILPIHVDSLAAQYFGRNQVQYETFDFRILKTENFDVYYYPEAEIAAQDAARMAERWYARYSRLLNYEFEDRQPLVLFADHPDFQQNNIIGAVGEGTQGATEPFKRRIVMPFMHSYAETDHLIGHELVHAFQFDIAGFGQGTGLEQAARRYQVPLWFSEGMAEYLSSGPIDAGTAVTLRDAALTGEVPTLEQLTRDRRFFPYTWGHALWAYVGGRWGDAVIGQILKQVGQGVPYPDAFQRILNISLEELSDEFQIAVRRAYLPLLAERSTARETGDPLITDAREGGRLNIGPVLSPDGSRVAFLSELGGLDIALYVADAETGEVIRRLVRGTNFDPHFGSLRFINSAGTWSPDGERFAFSALREGADVLVVLDIDRADVLREYRIEGIGEITNPAWSPDGRTIVFSGLDGGITDLYALDLETGQSRQLTSDRYADLHPAFSPDGQTLAFVSDRGPGTDLETLDFGAYTIALMEWESGEIRLAPNMEADNVNPTWTRDGSGLYFVSNRTGIPNVYRLELATGDLFRITNLFTGVKGITPLSPTITTARATDRLLFTAVEENGYNIYSLEDPTALAGVPVPMTEVAAADTVVPLPATLPPIPRPTEAPFLRVAQYLDSPEAGLPPPAAVDTAPVVAYSPSLSLDWLGQPRVGASVGGGPFNRGGLYGGIAGIFSDMLGRHTLFGTIQAQGQLDEIGFSTVYLYRRSRWNLGAAAQRIPIIFGGFRQFIDPSDNLFKRQFLRFRYFTTGLQGLAQYPFSTVQRMEFNAGLRRISRDVQIFEQVYDPATGFLIGRGDREVDLGSYNLFETSAALVYDNALFGITSPFAGQRYRFEISPTFGDLQFVQALADYRRYFWMRPFTLAIRGVHFGRYGADAGNRLFGYGTFLGYPSLVRGYYDVYDSCRSRGEACDLVEPLFGNKVGVVNAELRFPLIRALVLGFANIQFPPIEGFVFGDAGVAWGQSFDGLETRPVFRRGIQDDPLERGIITSAGVGLRANLFGYFIMELDYVRPFAREGWHWQFAVQPGF